MQDKDLVSSATLARFIGVVQNVARCVTRQMLGDLDTLALDRQDYEQIFMDRAWKALKRWRRDPALACQGRRAEERYVCASLWTEARVYERKRARPKRRGSTVPFFERELVDEGFESRMLARHDLNAASRRVPASELDAFRRHYTEGGSSINWRLRRKSRKAREIMSEILDNGIMP